MQKGHYLLPLLRIALCFALVLNTDLSSIMRDLMLIISCRDGMFNTNCGNGYKKTIDNGLNVDLIVSLCEKVLIDCL